MYTHDRFLFGKILVIVNIRILIQNEYFKWRCTSCQIKQKCSDGERKHYTIVDLEGKKKENEQENANEILI